MTEEVPEREARAFDTLQAHSMLIKTYALTCKQSLNI